MRVAGIPDDVPHGDGVGGRDRVITPRRADEIVGSAAPSMPTPSGPVQGPEPPPTRSAATALLLLYGASVNGGHETLDRSGARIMIRWEYAHLSAGFDGVTQQWTVTMRVPGRDMEKRSVTGVGWISQILNELGHEGWELISRDATGTSGNDFVTGWQFILKRPSG